MNTDALNALKKRRSIRSYKPEQITDAELNAVLEAGTYAPSGMGKQSAIIIAVQNKDDIKQLSKMNAAVIGKLDEINNALMRDAAGPMAGMNIPGMPKLF